MRFPGTRCSGNNPHTPQLGVERRRAEDFVERFQGEVVLMGETATYHVKQLAQHGVLDIMPSIRLYNRITVH